jgi:DNA-binding response OmpR family regulator
MSGMSRYGQAPLLIGLVSGVSPREYVVEGEACTLGRGAGCNMVVEGGLISRLHATITRHGPRYLLADAGSRNGTFVNGSRIGEPHLLDNDDLIGLGSPEAQVRFLDPDPTDIAAAPEASASPAARLRYDPQSMSFSMDGRPLELTMMQLRLLLHLYRNAGAVCSRESCAEAIWGRDYDPGMDAGALDQALNSLRRALGRVAAGASLIQTRRGLGYVLVLSGA